MYTYKRRVLYRTLRFGVDESRRRGKSLRAMVDVFIESLFLSQRRNSCLVYLISLIIISNCRREKRADEKNDSNEIRNCRLEDINSTSLLLRSLRLLGEIRRTFSDILSEQVILFLKSPRATRYHISKPINVTFCDIRYRTRNICLYEEKVRLE